MTEPSQRQRSGIFAVAPMMDWTDRHCRFFHRQLTRHALLFTEMIVADAILHGDRDRLLAFSPQERPLALQLGGSEPEKLARAAAIAVEYGYDEINLNVGCPSDRVHSGSFGACLMRTPALVAECVAALKAAVPLPLSVKCRLGVDEQDPEIALDALADGVIAAGADALWVHARKAWLTGLSPKENRTVPPLDHDRVRRLRARVRPHFVGANGGIETLDAAEAHLGSVDGVMIGRAAYHNPALLAEVDRRFYGAAEDADPEAAVAAMIVYAGRAMAGGARLNHVTRHMLGLFLGHAGARRWRQILSAEAVRPGAGPEVIERAFAALGGKPTLAPGPADQGVRISRSPEIA